AAGVFMRQFLQETGKEMLINMGLTAAQLAGEEAIHEFTPKQWREAMEKSEMATSFGLGTVLAIGQGLLAHHRMGSDGVFHYEPVSPAAEKAFLRSYAVEGFTVQKVAGDRYHVWPPNSHPGAAPFVLQRGAGNPPAKVFPEGYVPPSKPSSA